jgi:hypothetical protein
MLRAVSRARNVALAALGAALLCVGLAQASYPKPPTGPWKLGPPGSGFTLKDAKGKVVLGNLHFRSPAEESCPEKPGPVKVLGSYPLKQFHRGGYTAWGVGKNVGGEPGYMAAKFVVAGKTVNGSFYLTWDYSNPGRIIRGAAEFGSCRTEFLTGSPK